MDLTGRTLAHIDIDAGHQACRHNLALIYSGLERFQETVTHYEYLVQRGATNATSFGNLAGAYVALGEVDKARGLVDAFSKRNPENAAGHTSVGFVRLAAGQFEEAIQSFDRAQLLDPTETNSLVGRVLGQVLREDWPAARAAATTLANGADSTRKWFGGLSLSALALYEGRSAEALSWAERAARAYQPGARSSVARTVAAEILSARTGSAGRPDGAASPGRRERLQRGACDPGPGRGHPGCGGRARGDRAGAGRPQRQGGSVGAGTGRSRDGNRSRPGGAGPGGSRSCHQRAGDGGRS